jgi:hypothetical protein
MFTEKCGSLRLYPKAQVWIAEADRNDVLPIEGSDQLLNGQRRIVRHAECPGKDVGRAPRQHREGRLAAGDSGGHLVQGAVAAKGHHGVEAPAGGILGETSGMAAAVGFHHLDVVVAGQVLVDHHGVAGGHRRGEGVHDQQESHSPLTVPVDPPAIRHVRCAGRHVCGAVRHGGNRPVTM